MLVVDGCCSSVYNTALIADPSHGQAKNKLFQKRRKLDQHRACQDFVQAQPQAKCPSTRRAPCVMWKSGPSWLQNIHPDKSRHFFLTPRNPYQIYPVPMLDQPYVMFCGLPRSRTAGFNMKNAGLELIGWSCRRLTRNPASLRVRHKRTVRSQLIIFNY